MFNSRAHYSFPAQSQTISRRRRIWSWIVQHKKITIPAAIMIVLAIGGGVFVWYKLTRKPTPPPAAPVIAKKEKKAPPPPKYYSPLTGMEVAKDKTQRPVTAIMIENSPSARPQSGLTEAGVVYEAIAEGGITRFLTLFQETSPQLIGPVRSLRMYYLEWAIPYNPSIVHVGGSRSSLDRVRNGSYKDLDQFFNPSYFWRAADRPAPHNVYTSFDKLDALNKEKGYYTFDANAFKGFPREDEKPNKTPKASKIQVTISSATYNSSYTYDQGSNCYLRSYQYGGAHIDRETGKQLCPKVVIVMKAHENTVLEDGYRQSIQTTGSDPAYIFENGNVIEGTWERSDIDQQLKFKDQNGGAISLVRGQTWLTAIPETKSVGWQ